jgi:hypothetical protein
MWSPQPIYLSNISFTFIKATELRFTIFVMHLDCVYLDANNNYMNLNLPKQLTIWN